MELVPPLCRVDCPAVAKLRAPRNWRLRRAHFFLLIACLWSPNSAWAVEERSPHEEVLDKVGIKADAPSIRQYFLSLHPSAETRSAIAALLARLGDDDFHHREQAMKQLLRMPAVAVDLLQGAAQGKDPEVGWRARQVLEHADQSSRDLLLSAFMVVEQRKLRGELVEPLLAAVPLCSEEYLREAARRALAATSSTDDAEDLRRHFSHADPHVRIAALTALAKTSGPAASQHLLPLLADGDERVRVAAARALASHGRRESLPVLVALLDSPELSIRLASLRTLKGATGQDLGFVAYENEKVRAPAREKWQAWLAAEGASATLKTPLQEAAVEIGRTLICNHAQSKLIEYDLAGRQVWEQGVDPQPWSCQGLPDGRRLVASYNNRTVIEYDAAGKESWRAGGLPGGPTSVQRLENGNTLLACTDSQKVVELDRAGKIVWEVTVDGRPCDAQRLDDGRTLLALQNASKVAEIDRSGKIVWEIASLANPFAVQRLENGNTLVAIMGAGQVAEFDRSGKKVWSKEGLSNPYDAQRLSGGNTLVVDSTGVMEVDPSGKVVWNKGQSAICRVSRY